MESVTKNRQTKHGIGNMVRRVFGDSIHEEEIGIRELSDGFYNVAYEITLPNQEVILKIAPPPNVRTLDYEDNIMRAEVDGLRLMKERTRVPVPHIFHYDESRQLCDAPYFIMEKLKGDSLFQLREKLSHEKKREILQETGRLNREMNEIEGSRFGYLGQPNKQGKVWKEVFLKMMEDVLKNGEEVRICLGEGMEYEPIRRLIEKASFALDEVTKPYFVHWDLWDGNIFVHRDRISGFIDFERALWGDPLMEFFFRHNNYNDSFVKGYGTDLRKEAPIRARLYDIYLYLIMVIETAYRNYPDDWQYNFASKSLFESMNELKMLV